MWVIGRSDSALSGMSVSSRITGTRPTWTSQTAAKRPRPGSPRETGSGPPARPARGRDQRDGGEEVAPGQLEGDGERLAVLAEDPQDRQLGQIVVRVRVLLVTVRIDRLAKVAVLVEQAHTDEWHGHVAGRLDVVAGEDTQAAGVDAQALVEAVLGAEVGDGAVQGGPVLAVEPVLAAPGHVAVEACQHLGVLGHEGRVVEQIRPGDRLRQDFHGVPVARPRQAVDAAEQRSSSRIPAPPHVVGQATQTLELRWQPEGRARERRNLYRVFHLSA